MTTTYDWKADVEQGYSGAADPQNDPVIDASEILEKEEVAKSSTLSIKAPMKLSQRPLFLIAIVGGGLTTVILAIFIGWGTVSFISGAIQDETNKSNEPAKNAFNAKTPFDGTTPLTENQRLKEQLTSKDTDATVTRFNTSANAHKEKKVDGEKAQGTGGSESTPSSEKPSTAPSGPPPSRVVAPKIVYRDRTVTKQLPAPPPKTVYKERVVTKTVPASRSSITPSPAGNLARQQSSIPDLTPQDPYEQWNKLAGLGMVGGTDVAPQPAPYQAQNAIASNSLFPVENESIPVFDPSSFPEAPGELETEVYSPRVDLALGTVVKGELMHDVSFIDGSTSTDKAVVQLNQPLGEIPKGAMVSTQIEGVDDNGALSMSILGYEYENVYQTASLPEIQVTSSKASSGGGLKLGGLIKDVVGIGLDVLSDETGQDIEFNNGRVTSISTDTSSSILDSGLDAVSSRLLDRNRSRSSGSKRSPKVKKGSTVKFVVIEPFS